MTTDGDADPVYRADCPSRAILDQIADKWSMLVLAVLREPRRFNAVKRRLDGITQRVLTQTLRKLERNGMITRRVIDGPVLGVEYALTPSAARSSTRSRSSTTGPSNTWERLLSNSNATMPGWRDAPLMFLPLAAVVDPAWDRHGTWYPHQESFSCIDRRLLAAAACKCRLE